uniref:Uncharacterized protein n=1 Tax=Anopheles dirus TaxID=7168 RepID=A0A182NX07_9DIPT
MLMERVVAAGASKE